MAHQEERTPAWIYFGTGLILISVAAVISAYLHHTSIGRHLEMVNLDAWVRSAKTVEDKNIAIVQITDEDYKGPVFQRGCPLPVAGVSKLIRAVGLSSPTVIVVDLDTVEWTKEQRAAVRDDVESARKKAGLAKAVPIAWAIGGAQGASGGTSDVGSLSLEAVQDSGSCFGVPAAIPDDYGVVRGYLPFVPQNGAPIPSLAVVAERINKGQGCTSEIHAPVGNEIPEADLINYAGGPARFPHLTAGTVLAAADTTPWQNSNPLQARIALVGGAFQEGRDRYVTPYGYLNGLDILASAVVSASLGPMREPERSKFILMDVLLGMLLVTGGYFLRKYWLLAISFIAIPFIAFAASLAIFNTTGYYMSFIPVIAAVFLHHLIEHAVEHWHMKRELKELRAKVHQA